MSRSVTRRRLLAAALAIGVGTAVAVTTTATASTTPEPAPGAQTRTITHVFGTIEVPADPQRIVSVGYEEQETILHFDKVPILQREYWGAQPFATWPWSQPYLNGAEPEVFEGDIPFERIAALEPDLIMATNAGLDRETYDRLAEIAPTVAHHPDYAEWNTPSDVGFVFVGRVFGMEAEALQMLADVQRTFADTRAEHPEWAELTAATLTVWDGVIYVDTLDHGRGQLVANFGFGLPADVIAPDADGQIAIPLENIDQLDQFDIIIWINGEPTSDSVVDLPLRTQLRLHQEGREIYAGWEKVAAFHSAPHALDFTIDWLVPAFEAAADGDPATPVAESVEAGIAP